MFYFLSVDSLDAVCQVTVNKIKQIWTKYILIYLNITPAAVRVCDFKLELE